MEGIKPSKQVEITRHLTPTSLPGLHPHSMCIGPHADSPLQRCFELKVGGSLGRCWAAALWGSTPGPAGSGAATVRSFVQVDDIALIDPRLQHHMLCGKSASVLHLTNLMAWCSMRRLRSMSMFRATSNSAVMQHTIKSQINLCRTFGTLTARSQQDNVTKPWAAHLVAQQLQDVCERDEADRLHRLVHHVQPMQLVRRQQAEHLCRRACHTTSQESPWSS